MEAQFIRRAAVAFLATSLLALSACSRSGEITPVNAASGSAVTAPVVRVKRRNLSNDLQIASEFIPYQEIDVHAKVSGYVKKLYINWGTHVRAGQLMAVLEVPELEAQVLRDKAAYARSKQELAFAEEELDRAGSAYKVAHLTYTRLYGVQKTRPDLVAQEEVDVAQGKDLEASAAVAGAKDTLAAAQEELTVAQSTLDKDQVMFDYSTITAPFDGVVTQLYAYTGSLLPAGTSTSTAALALCRLSQNDLLRLVIPVPEAVVDDVRVGEAVNVRVVASNRTFPGKVSLVSGQIDLDTRTMHTEVEVPNPKYLIVPGMYAYVELPVRSAVSALAVPVQAVESTQPDQGTVLVVNGQDQIELRSVRIGIQTANNVQILSGLREGELVIFGSQGSYHAGEIVKPSVVNLAALGVSE